MLRFLSIRNLAVIDRLELEFEPGLNVLTGETGAGKSILVGAVGLLVGGRASADLVRTGEETRRSRGHLRHARRRGGHRPARSLGAGAQPRVRRRRAGHQRRAARAVAATLVDLHGQHEHQVLLDPADASRPARRVRRRSAAERAAVADAFAALAGAPRPNASGCWRASARRRRAPSSCRSSSRRSIASRRSRAKTTSSRPTRQVLGNADKLQRLCADAYDALYEGEQAALPALGDRVEAARRARRASTRASRPTSTPATAVKSQLEDLAFFLRSYAAGIDASPARLQEVEDRLALLERLKKKHGPTLDDVIAKARRSCGRSWTTSTHGDRAAPPSSTPRSARDAAPYLARGRARCRRRVGRRRTAVLRARSRSRSRDLAMARTRCEVRFTRRIDRGPVVRARASNRRSSSSRRIPGEDLRPLARIASGGELSRIMLALKTLASTDAPGKTLIFDEVDAGIGGAVADVVGARLQRLGRAVPGALHHAPAADCGVRRRRTSASRKSVRRADADRVARLGGAEREEELARMIGGTDVSPAVLASAREMLRVPAGTRAKGEDERRKRKRKRKRKSSRKYLIETYGCQMNVHDSERMAGLLEQAGYEPTDGRSAMPT